MCICICMYLYCREAHTYTHIYHTYINTYILIRDLSNNLLKWMSPSELKYFLSLQVLWECVLIYLCICVCMYIYICVCVCCCYKYCENVYRFICVSMYIYMCVCCCYKYCENMFSFICVVCVYIYTCIYTHTHIIYIYDHFLSIQRLTL